MFLSHFHLCGGMHIVLNVNNIFVIGIFKLAYHEANRTI